MLSLKKIISQAPARICLFGEHQDYLGLPVIAAAADLYLTITASSNNCDVFRISFPDTGKSREISIHDPVENLNSRDYLSSSVKVIRKFGCKIDQGYDIEITSNIPINAGASSSTALTVAWIQLLIKLFYSNKMPSPETIAQLAYQAEVLEHGEPGGMMDQYTIALGNVIFLKSNGQSCLAKTLTPKLDGLIIADSMVPKKTLGVIYRIKTKVNQCITILNRHFPGFSLKDISLDEASRYTLFLPGKMENYFLAAVNNHDLTQRAIQEFYKDQLDPEYLGSLMNQHHFILKNLLKITVPEIDRMIDAALEAGAMGVKVNGSGGGGSIAILAPGAEQQVIESLKIFNARTYKVNVCPGSRIL